MVYVLLSEVSDMIKNTILKNKNISSRPLVTFAGVVFMIYSMDGLMETLLEHKYTKESQ